MIRAKSIRPRLGAWIVELEDILAFLDHRVEYEEWCLENTISTYIMPGRWGKTIIFADREDAMMCYLTFR